MKTSKILPLLLSAAMSVSASVSSIAAMETSQPEDSLPFEKSDIQPDLYKTRETVSDEEIEEPAADEQVRVSIVLKDESVLEAGYDADSVTSWRAVNYRSKLKSRQKSLARTIENKVLGGEQLDVVWNLTLALNAISANVEYGKLEQIEALDGVEEVIIENRYLPTETQSAASPTMSVATNMVNAPVVYSAGYSGQGQRIAVIDTGTDTDHQSFDADAYEYSLSLEAEKKGMSLEEYKESLDLLDEEEIGSVLSQLHAFERSSSLTASDLYVSSKLAFGYNYVDWDLDIDHDNDDSGEHGSHVAGIATANAYIEKDGEYVSALDEVQVQGAAPDAQLITMKVFGKNGGAFDSDYMVAIEDAIVLGCDTINLSLGDLEPGFTTNKSYQQVMDNLIQTQSTVAIGAGNNWAYSDFAYGAGSLSADDISFVTIGAPGSYDNALTVASVENDGFTGNFFTIDGTKVFYYDPASNPEENVLPFSTLQGEQQYILIDGFGTEEEFEALKDVLQGKIAVCSRGGRSFADKANAAIENGAIGVMIYNTEPGVLAVSMDDCAYTNPAAGLSRDGGDQLRKAASPVYDEDGSVWYYEGTVNITNDFGNLVYGSNYYTLSSFSSWGVPGSLTLKPEITAPGGNIYSVNGLDPSGTAYETMSGTSMATPQISGLGALLGQRIKEEGLQELTGKSQRFLTQSLLMSTAVPMMEENSGSYYSVMNQGSGLAQIDQAILSTTYIEMDEDATDSAEDGKVKAELMDDPDREGSYSYGFTINNFGEDSTSYTLSTDLFTQDIFDLFGQGYLDTWTTLLSADISYTIDGKEYIPSSSIDADLNEDGITDAKDAQLILDAVNKDETEALTETADLDGDGEITSYDAYLILTDLTTESFEIPAGDSAHVQVNMELNDKEGLDERYVNGAYVEGYTFVNSVADKEGSLNASHSIPILGFYGNWSDASMFDKNSYTQALYGDETIPYTGVLSNNLILSIDGEDTWFTGNPYTVEETYPADKLAVKSSDVLSGYRITSIRNARAGMTYVSDEEGNVLAKGELKERMNSAFFNIYTGEWQDVIHELDLNRTVSSLNQKEGDQITVSAILVPEYYLDEELDMEEQLDKLIAGDVLGSGTVISTTMTIDDTAPELLSVQKDAEDGSLTVKAQDNQNIAYVAVMSADGETEYTGMVPETDEEGNAEASFNLDTDETGSGYLIVAGDYAGNQSSWLVGNTDKTDLEAAVNEAGKLLAEDWTENSWSPFKEVLNEARAMLDNEYASQQETDQITEKLAAARAGLIQRASDSAIVSLKQLSEEAKGLKDSYTESQFKDVQAWMNQAQELLADPANAPAARASEVLIGLSQAMAAIHDFDDINVLKDMLKEALEAAQEVNTDNVRPAQIEKFNEAITNGWAVVEDEEASEADILDAMNELARAQENLWEIVSKADLEALIEKAEGISSKGWSDDSFKALQQAVEAAKEAAGNDDASEQDVEEAMTALSKAIADLQPLDSSSLQSQIEAAEKILEDKDVYDSDSIAKLEEALSKAKEVLENSGSQDELDQAAKELKQAADNLTPAAKTMYRLYNPNSGEHFYTSSETERDNVIKAGWMDEGISWYAPAKSSTPVYRLYNKNAGDHHYTMDIAERDALIALGWKDEGIGWYSDDAMGVALLRQYNPNAISGSHNYTPDTHEHSYLTNNGWNDEGIAWYGMKTNN